MGNTKDQERCSRLGRDAEKSGAERVTVTVEERETRIWGEDGDGGK